MWTGEGIDKEFRDSVRELYPVMSVVQGDVVLLDIERAGWFIPLDAIEIDPEKHADVWQAPELRKLAGGQVVLSQSSAALRGAILGDSLSIEGHHFEVSGIVPDEMVGAAEVVFHREDENSPVKTTRYLLVAADMTAGAFADSIRAINPDLHLRIRTEGDVPFLRSADAVAPQVMIKAALGEFAINPGSGRAFEQDEEWQDESIVAASLPLVGTSKCHRVVAERATAALSEIADQGLGRLIDPDGYAGCWVARFIGGNRGVSRHAWGAAIDINAPDNLFGTSGDMDRRIVEIMERHGFTWGGRWLTPDPMHFEYLPAGFDPAGS